MIRGGVNDNALYDNLTIRDALTSFREERAREYQKAEHVRTRVDARRKKLGSRSGVNAAGTRRRGTERVNLQVSPL